MIIDNAFDSCWLTVCADRSGSGQKVDGSSFPKPRAGTRPESPGVDVCARSVSVGQVQVEQGTKHGTSDRELAKRWSQYGVDIGVRMRTNTLSTLELRPETTRNRSTVI